MKKRKNRMKRIASVWLAVMLTMVCLVPETFAVTIHFSGDCGDNLSWTLNSAGVLTISGDGAMEDFDAHAWGDQEPWYEVKDQIKEVIIEEGVTSIGTDAFEHCHYIEKVTLPSTLKSIGEYAFLMNIALEEVTIPEGVTEIGDGAFQYCEVLRKADLPSSLRSLGSCVFCEDPITQVVIPQGMTKIEWSTFHDCLELRSVVLPASVAEIERNAFRGCTSLTTVTGGAGVTNIGANAFGDTPWQKAQGDFAVLGSVLAAYNGSAKSVSVPDGTVRIADSAFEGNMVMKTVAIPNSVTGIGSRAFADCTALTELKMPDSAAEVGSEAFSGCTALKTLVLSKNLSTLGEKAFAGCTALTAVEIPAGLKKGPQVFDGCSALKKAVFQDKMTEIPDELFENCTGLTEIAFPKNLKTIGEKAFSGCTGLTEILFPATLEKIGWNAFSNCSGLKKIYIPIRTTSIGGGAFYGAAEDLEVYYAGNEMDFFGLDETTRNAMANGYAPYFNATGFSIPGGDEIPADGLARSGRKSVRKLTWAEICGKYDLLVKMPDNLYQTEPVVSSKGYRPGVLTKDAVNYYQNAINYYRAVAGVSPVALTDERNESAAWGSLAMAMNGVMTHYPDKPSGMSDADYARAYYATTHSNLSYSNPPSPIWAIIGQIEDSDSSNAHDLGHRRWLLSPYIATMGVGLAHNGDNLYTTVRVFGDGEDEINADDYDFVSWPASGNNLSETFTPDVIWSVSLNGSKYEPPLYDEVSVKIRSFLSGTEWELSSDSTQETTGWFNVSNRGYGYMNTIVFQPNTRVEFEGDYLVTVSGLHLRKDGSEATIQYLVTFKSYGEAMQADDSDYNPFWDVSSKDYYYEPVKWAVQQGITNGTGETTFSPEQVCTRAQVVTFLWRAMGSPEPKKGSSSFTDVKDPKSWYYKAVLWAAQNGITAGVDADHFAPEQTVTRAQFVTFLWRAAGEEPVSSGSNPFEDLGSPGSWYYNAVLWAVENGITNGIDPTHFGPGKGCTRGQVVTFLHRHLAKQ